jgi:SAM-dependent methyltransferase
VSAVKKVSRYEPIEQYWDRRWTEAEWDADRFIDLSIYPIKYAEMVTNGSSGRVLEVGAGLGRVLKHYHYAGYDIAGVERSEVAVQRLREENQDFDIRSGDARSLPYHDEEFGVVLAFGVYHSIEEDMEGALEESSRVLKSGGRFCISMRPNNIEMNFNESYWRWKQRNHRTGQATFHKWLVGEQEFRRILSRHGLETEQVHLARNVSLLYRVPWLRQSSSSETERRAHGYRLNLLGRTLDRMLVATMPSQFCNVMVFIGRKMG